MSLRRLGSPVEQFVNEPSDDRDLPVNHFVRVAATFTNMDQREQKIAIGIVSVLKSFQAIKLPTEFTPFQILLKIMTMSTKRLKAQNGHIGWK